MAVIPGTSDPVPDGGNSVNLAGLAWLQDVDEASVRQNAYDQVFPSMKSAKDSLLGNLLGGLFKGFTDILNGLNPATWLPQSVQDAAVQVRDGQIALNDRQDLVDNLLNMGRTYCSATQNYTGGVWAKMPFNTQLGVLRECSLIPGGIKVKRKGQWNIWAQVYIGNMTAPFATRDIAWQIRVYVPPASGTGDWVLHSKTDGRYVGNNPGHDTIMTSVTFDAPEANIEVWACSNMSGKIFGFGPSYNQLTVQQVTSQRLGEDGSGNSGLPDE